MVAVIGSHTDVVYHGIPLLLSKTSMIKGDMKLNINIFQHYSS